MEREITKTLANKNSLKITIFKLHFRMKRSIRSDEMPAKHQPSHLGRAAPYIRLMLLLLVLSATFVLVAPIQAVLRLLKRPESGLVQRRFSQIVSRVLGIRIVSSGFAYGAKPNLIVANHVSWTDIIALTSVTPSTFLAKSEVATWPLLGALARLQGTVFIRRGDRRQIASVNAELNGVLRNGENLVIFPEGTSTHGVMEPRFNPSHFAVTQFTDAAILPVAIFYADDTGQADVGWYGDMTFLPHLWRLMQMRGVECHILFGDAIHTREADRKSIAAQAQEQVRKLLIRARDAHVVRLESRAE